MPDTLALTIEFDQVCTHGGGGGLGEVQTPSFGSVFSGFFASCVAPEFDITLSVVFV